MNEHIGTLRLDPRHPLVWRSPTSLQLGVDAPIVRFDAVTPAEERMLHALTTGVSLEGLRMIGANSRGAPRSAARLLERVAPALERAGRPPVAALSRAPLAGHRIALGGSSPVRSAVGDALQSLGAEVFDDADSRETERSGDSGMPVDPLPTLAIVVSSWFTPPQRSAAWLRLDVPHLDIVFSDAEVTLGPLVVPGLGPCLHCRDLHRLERDASWPAIAGQLIGRAAPTEVPLTVIRVLAALAEFVVAEFVSAEFVAAEFDTAEFVAAEACGGRSIGRVLRVDAETGVVSEGRQPGHPECACRALPETVTGPGSANGSPRSPPTTASGAGGPG